MCINSDPEVILFDKCYSKSASKVCVSAIDPALFPACVEAGAEMVELGNFDSFYEQGLTFSAEDVLEMTRKTRSLLPTIPLSVTVPHTLDLDEQVRNLGEGGAGRGDGGRGVFSVVLAQHAQNS